MLYLTCQRGHHTLKDSGLNTHIYLSTTQAEQPCSHLWFLIDELNEVLKTAGTFFLDGTHIDTSCD